MDSSNVILFLVFAWVLFSFFVGMASSEKEIGFWAVFFISIFFSPVIGLIAGIISRKKGPKEVIVVNNNSTADELIKLKELLDKQVISEKEFIDQKNKLLKG